MTDKEMGDAELLANSPFDDDLDTALAAKPPRGRPGPALYLAAGLILVAGFVAGAQVQKWRSGDEGPGAAASANRPNGPAGQAGGPGGYGGPGGAGPGGPGRAGAGAAGGVTAGSVTRVEGSTIYVRTASGAEVKVTTGGTTKVRVTKDGALRDLAPGTSVVVRGAAGADGAVAATNVSQAEGRR